MLGTGGETHFHVLMALRTSQVMEYYSAEKIWGPVYDDLRLYVAL